MAFLLAEPGQPGKPECVNRNRERIELEWKPPKNDGGNPIQGYLVERREKGAKKKDWTPIHRGDMQRVSAVSFLFFLIKGPYETSS